MEPILIVLAFAAGAVLVWKLHDKLAADLAAIEARVSGVEAKATALIAKL